MNRIEIRVGKTARRESSAGLIKGGENGVETRDLASLQGRILEVRRCTEEETSAPGFQVESVSEPVVLVVQLKSRVFRWAEVEAQREPILAVSINVRVEVYQTVTNDACENRLG